MEEIKFSANETFKLFIRSGERHPLPQPSIQRIFNAIKAGAHIIYVPDGVEFIVVKEDGSVKVY
jgi:hypothetical protein